MERAELLGQTAPDEIAAPAELGAGQATLPDTSQVRDSGERYVARAAFR